MAVTAFHRETGDIAVEVSHCAGSKRVIDKC